VPNGRSGDFWLPVMHLQQMLEELPGGSTIGRIFTEDKFIAVSGDEVAQWLNEFDGTVVHVEEHDLSQFMARLSAAFFVRWVFIDEDSPLHERFRLRQSPGTYNIIPGWYPLPN
jgi:hypothetical protein